MPKQKVVVNEKSLRRAIKETEAAKTYTSQNAMFNDAAGKYTEIEADGPTISGAIVRSRALEFGITFKTPKGKKGNFSKKTCV